MALNLVLLAKREPERCIPAMLDNRLEKANAAFQAANGLRVEKQV